MRWSITLLVALLMSGGLGAGPGRCRPGLRERVDPLVWHGPVRDGRGCDQGDVHVGCRYCVRGLR